MREFVNQLLSNITLSRLVGRGVKLQQKGAGEYVGLCPFHAEKTPSFTVSDNKQFYHCFGCSAHGNAIEYVMQLQGLSFFEAVESLALEHGMQIPKKQSSKEIEEEESVYSLFELTASYYQKQLLEPAGKKALKYLKDRGLSDEVIAKFRLGFAPSDSSGLVKLLTAKASEKRIAEANVLAKSTYGGLYDMFHGRVIFPICNTYNKVIAFGGRVIDEETIGPKYLNSSQNPIFNKGQELFGLNLARKAAFASDEIIVVEGYMDVISLYSIGMKNVVAPLGTAIKYEQINKLFQIVANVVLCMDNDEAGYKSMKRVAEMAIPSISKGNMLKFAKLVDAKDPDEAATKFGKLYLERVFKDSILLSEFLFDDSSRLVNPNIPEAMAELKGKLISLSALANDQDIASSYRYYFLDRFYNFAKQHKKSLKYLDKQIKAQAIIASHKLLEPMTDFKILIVLLYYHALILDNYVMEELIKLDIKDKELDKIRGALLSYPLEPQVEVELKEKVKASSHYAICCKDVHMALFINGMKTLEDARVYVISLFELQTLNRIKLQIEEIERQMKYDHNEELFAKLRYLNLQKEELTIKLGSINV